MDQFCFNSNENRQKEQEIESLNIQILFLIAIIIATSISIYVIEGYKDIIINGKLAKHTSDELHDYAMVSSTIITIVTLYFLYLAFKTYKSQPTASNAIYLMVAILISFAAVLRLFTLASTPFEDENAEEIL